jgi:hypothetical protein
METYNDNDCEPVALTAAETIAELFARVPLPTYAKTVAAATLAAVATVQRFEGGAVEFEWLDRETSSTKRREDARADVADRGDDGMPWSLDLMPGRVEAEWSLEEWDAVAGGW